jgi:hypothetical protein
MGFALHAFLILCLSISSSPPEQFPLRDLVKNHELLRIASDLQWLKPLRRKELEMAAFIVRRGDHFDCLLWPPKFGSYSVTFRGSAPEGTVAIVHTHPRWSDEPSPEDIALAKRVALPVYVLTRSNITVATIGGKVSWVVASHYWSGTMNWVSEKRACVCHPIDEGNQTAELTK